MPVHVMCLAQCFVHIGAGKAHIARIAASRCIAAELVLNKTAGALAPNPTSFNKT